MRPESKMKQEEQKAEINEKKGRKRVEISKKMGYNARCVKTGT